MQELTYINLRGEEARFGAERPYVFCALRGTEGAEVKYQAVRGAYRHGETTVGALREPRHLDLTMHIFAGSREELYRLRQELCGMLGAERALDAETGERARIVYQNDFGKWWTWAVPEGAPRWDKRLQDIHPELKIAFRCDSPFWYGMEEHSGGFVCKNEGFRLPLRFPMHFDKRVFQIDLMNGGHVAAPVEMTIWGKGETPSILNKTTGERLRLTAPLMDGAKLMLSTDPEDLYVLMETDGKKTNAYGLLDVETPVSAFTLAPGVNRVVYEPGGATAQSTIEIRWHDRYEGV